MERGRRGSKGLLRISFCPMFSDKQTVPAETPRDGISATTRRGCGRDRTRGHTVECVGGGFSRASGLVRAAFTTTSTPLGGSTTLGRSTGCVHHVGTRQRGRLGQILSLLGSGPSSGGLLTLGGGLSTPFGCCNEYRRRVCGDNRRGNGPGCRFRVFVANKLSHSLLRGL